MRIPVDVPGLNTLIPDVPGGGIVVVDGASDPAKSFLLRHLAASAMHLRAPVTFVTSGDAAEVLRLFQRENGGTTASDGPIEVIERESLSGLENLTKASGLLSVDSFSFLAMELDGVALARIVRRLRKSSREHQTAVVLGTDRGMLDHRSEAVVEHLTDGMLQFNSREGPEGLLRFLRVPKWPGGKSVDRNIYYDFDGNRIAVDLRRRTL